MKKKYSVIHLIKLLLFITIVTGLINSDYFYSSTYTAYYLFVCSALVLILTIESSSLFLTKSKALNLSYPILFLGLWCLYIIGHYLNHSASSLFTIYILVHFLLLLALPPIFNLRNFKINTLFYCIIVVSTIESLYCLTQYLGVLKPQNELFAVTGSWINPNVTAQFLAMTVPVFLYLVQSKFKKIILSSLGVVLIALLLLKCRSALIGALLSITVFYSLEYDFIHWIKNKKNKNTVKVLLVLCLLIIIPVSSHLYNSKKASADGRLMIWKLSSMMAIEKPLTGYGYGSFSKEYNLFQAEYIQKGKATLEEQNIASPTIMAHNELLQNAVEGGGIGLVILAFFFGSTIFSIQQNKRINAEIINEIQPAELQIKKRVFHLAYAGVIGFIGMSMFNFAIQAAPVMILFIVYEAIICSQLEPITPPKSFSFLNRRLFYQMIKVLIVLCSIFMFYVVVNVAYTDSLNQKASILKKEGRHKEALKIMPNLEPWLNEESNYWKNYGSILFLTKNYTAALRCLTKAKETSSRPELYLGSGLCYEKLHQYSQAIDQYRQLVLLHPSKFNYRYRLMTAYLQNKDTLNTIQAAQGIINLKPKTPSAEVTQYKKIAFKIGVSLDENFKNKIAVKNTFSITKQQTRLNF